MWTYFSTTRPHVLPGFNIANPYKKLSGSRENESSEVICNADMRIAEIHQFCQLQDEGQSLMRSAMSQLQLSARAYAQHDVIAS